MWQLIKMGLVLSKILQYVLGPVFNLRQLPNAPSSVKNDISRSKSTGKILQPPRLSTKGVSAQPQDIRQETARRREPTSLGVNYEEYEQTVWAVMEKDCDESRETSAKTVRCSAHSIGPQCEETVPDSQNSALTKGTQYNATVMDRISVMVQTESLEKCHGSRFNTIDFLEDGLSYVAMELRLLHVNLFMLKKHFDEDLSRLISRKMDAKFHRIQKIGNFLFLVGREEDLKIAEMFCSQKYDGHVVKFPDVPRGLHVDKTATWLEIEPTIES